ncbi:MAG: chorismate mutase [Frankiaceae bacterium]|nr:chorismate mutase [Frankiaceae bacterium]
MAVRAVRGAIQVDVDERDEIISAVAEMIDAVLSKNAFDADDLISIFFTVTPDIRSEFPAYATRKAGITDVPMMCSIEIPVEGAMPRVVRMMAHVETNVARSEIRHAYLRGASALRTDLQH